MKFLKINEENASKSNQNYRRNNEGTVDNLRSEFFMRKSTKKFMKINEEN